MTAERKISPFRLPARTCKIGRHARAPPSPTAPWPASARPWSPRSRVAAPKLRAGDRGRAGGRGPLRRWARDSRDRARPLVWFHASSVGEGLQAESVLLELKTLVAARPVRSTPISARPPPALARRLPVDVADYLPYDLPGLVRPAPGGARAGPAGLLQARSLARAGHARRTPGAIVAHRRRHGEPRQRPAALARAPAPPAGLRRRLPLPPRSPTTTRADWRELGVAGGSDPRARAIRGSTASSRRCARCRRTIPCCASDAVHPLSWQAPPGRMTKRCSSTPSLGCGPHGPTPG